jgi:hypothetical protein
LNGAYPWHHCDAPYWCTTEAKVLDHIYFAANALNPFLVLFFTETSFGFILVVLPFESDQKMILLGFYTGIHPYFDHFCLFSPPSKIGEKS